MLTHDNAQYPLSMLLLVQVQLPRKKNRYIDNRLIMFAKYAVICLG